MLFIVPYRAKNPSPVFPYVTVTLIVLNTLIFALTCDPHHYLHIREAVVKQFAFTHMNFSPVTLLTAMFLHESPLHLIGNMLFLWIFGSATEGRLRPLRFLALYLCAGIIGDLLSDFVTGLLDPDMYNLGASGAIMGLAGAYLYLFPYTPIRLLWFMWFFIMPRGGVAECQARWIILYFVGLDVVNGILMGGGDGVGHFAHLGGAAAGFGAMWLLRIPRDNEEVAEVQATLSDMRDVTLLPFQDLEALMQRPTTDVLLIMAYCRQSLTAPFGASEAKCLWALRQYGSLLMEQADAGALAGLVGHLTLPTSQQIPAMFFLRLGSRLERLGDSGGAVRLYYRMCEVFPACPDIEMAYLRVARIMELTYGDRVQARMCYAKMLELFPKGAMCLEAEGGLRRLPAPAVVG